MYPQRGAAQYQAVRSHGLVADASPARLVQIMFEQILSQLAIARGCVGRIKNNMPLNEVIAKGKAMGKLASVTGGHEDGASGEESTVDGGFNNTASDAGQLGFEYLFVDAPGKPAAYQSAPTRV